MPQHGAHRVLHVACQGCRLVDRSPDDASYDVQYQHVDVTLTLVLECGSLQSTAGIVGSSRQRQDRLGRQIGDILEDLAESQRDG